MNEAERKAELMLRQMTRRQLTGTIAVLALMSVGIAFGGSAMLDRPEPSAPSRNIAVAPQRAPTSLLLSRNTACDGVGAPWSGDASIVALGERSNPTYRAASIRLFCAAMEGGNDK